jgi:hypothetical protein
MHLTFELRIMTVLASLALPATTAGADAWKYEAILSCGHSGTNINILACFAKSGAYGADTDLSVTIEGLQKLYKTYDLANVPYTSGSVVIGANTNIPNGMLVDDDGLHILLPDSFAITAQNSQDHLVLGIRIININSRETVYQQEVGHYGVITVGN